MTHANKQHDRQFQDKAMKSGELSYCKLQKEVCQGGALLPVLDALSCRQRVE